MAKMDLQSIFNPLKCYQIDTAFFSGQIRAIQILNQILIFQTVYLPGVYLCGKRFFNYLFKKSGEILIFSRFNFDSWQLY